MSIKATIHTWVGYVDTLSGTYINSNNATVSVDGMNTSAVLKSDTTPPATMATEFSIPLVSGAVSVNLAALIDQTGLTTINGTGLKVQAVKFRNPASNAGNMVVTEGASSGHPLLGTAFLFRLIPGQSLTLQNEGVDVGTDIASGDRLWDVTGTGTEHLEIGIVMG